jgi:hypothetical protein
MESAAMKVRRWPKFAVIHALSTMPTVIAASVPVDSHWARSCPMPKAPMMSGIATLTDVVVSIAAIAPSITVTMASQR